jgi:NAD(P)-dependent dehydrogenase (short-subunit alcohol dehydrogenase family)
MSSSVFTLTGKVVLVTGASSGIGRACAIRFADAGASLILLARNRTRLDETASMLPQETAFVIIEADLSTGILPEDALKDAVNKLGKLSGFLHAAGISTTLPLRMLDNEKLNHFYATNITGAVLLSKWMSKPANLHENGGSIVWLASVMGMVGEAGKTLYSLTKGALIAGAKSLAIELAPKKLRVNCISPGVVVTPMTDAAVYNQTEDAQVHIKALHPLGLGNTDDIAYAGVYLLSDASRWITGANIPIDGGYTAR